MLESQTIPGRKTILAHMGVRRDDSLRLQRLRQLITPMEAATSEGLAADVAALRQKLPFRGASMHFSQIPIHKALLRVFHLAPIDGLGAGVVAIGQEFGLHRLRQFDRAGRA